MIRYFINMSRVGAILDVGGMAASVVAMSNVKAQIIVYVDASDKEKFEKLVEGQDDVVNYVASPSGHVVRS